ncbi:MAG: hypothetical protein QNJ41_20160 [Xenococcaceae cyanobacterium MO_188.B32]|nr:hypothetical protein [Xenococcaceae cyanobacterium MO_188.B32]
MDNSHLANKVSIGESQTASYLPPPEIEIEQMLTLWEVFQTNLIAMYHYQPKVYPGSIVLLNASETPPEVIEEPTHGWGHLVIDGCAQKQLVIPKGAIKNLLKVG